MELGCGKEGLIFEVTDASFGALAQQPKFTFEKSDTTCEQKRIPKGDMCQVDPAKFHRFMEDKCVGRQAGGVLRTYTPPRTKSTRLHEYPP